MLAMMGWDRMGWRGMEWKYPVIHMVLTLFFSALFIALLLCIGFAAENELILVRWWKRDIYMNTKYFFARPSGSAQNLWMCAKISF